MSDPYEDIKRYYQDQFADGGNVTVNTGRGSQGLKYNKKLFVMFYKGDLVVKLSPKRVAEVIDTGEGQSFDPGTGTPMKDRVLIPESNRHRWLAFCEESRRHVSGA